MMMMTMIHELNKILKLSEAIIRLITSQPPQSDDKANEKYSIDKLTRLQRAMMSGINGGLPKSKAGHRSATKTSFHRLITERAHDSPHRRAGFTLNPTDLNDDGSLAYRKLFCETNVRHAQDLLLLAQIER